MLEMSRVLRLSESEDELVDVSEECGLNCSAVTLVAATIHQQIFQVVADGIVSTQISSEPLQSSL